MTEREQREKWLEERREQQRHHIRQIMERDRREAAHAALARFYEEDREDD